jgi:hypothetical protein
MKVSKSNLESLVRELLTEANIGTRTYSTHEVANSSNLTRLLKQGTLIPMFSLGSTIPMGFLVPPDKYRNGGYKAEKHPNGVLKYVLADDLSGI